MKHPASYIDDHLLVSVSLPYIGGIALSPFIRLSDTGDLLFSALLCFSLILLVVLHLLKQSQTLLCMLIPIVFAIGCYHGYLHLQVPADKNHIYNRLVSKTDLVLIGTMSTMAGFDGRTSQVVIEARSIRVSESPSLLPTKGKILLPFS